MRVPLYENQVSQNPGQPVGLPSVSAPPPVAFGTDAAAATEKIGQTLGQVGSVLANHMLEREHQKQLAQVIQADNDFRINLQKTMFDTTPDDNGVPKGVYTRSGLQAQGATESFDSQFHQMRQSSVDQMDTPFKKQRLSELMDENYPRLRELVAKHEGDQTRIGLNTVVDGNLKLRIQSAPDYMHDPEGLIKTIQTGQQLKYANMASNGVDPALITATLNDFAGKTVKSAIAPLVQNNPSAAQAFFDQVKSNPKNPLSAQDEEAIQKIIDSSTEQVKTRQKKQLAIGTNSAEASLSSKLANQQLTPLELDSAKGSVSPEFYNLTAIALKNQGVKLGTDDSRNKKFVTLANEYARIHEGDEDQQTAALMKFRREIIASSSELEPEHLQKLLSFTDPNFVQAAIQAPPGRLQAIKDALKTGISFITDHAAKYGGNGAAALSQFIDTMSSTPNPENVPALAQAAVRSQVLKSNPALMGRSDLANNVSSQAGGIKQVYGQKTNLKPDQRINVPTFKAGDEREKDGVAYVRGTDGLWRPKR